MKSKELPLSFETFLIFNKIYFSLRDITRLIESYFFKGIRLSDSLSPILFNKIYFSLRDFTRLTESYFFKGIRLSDSLSPILFKHARHYC